MGKGAAICLRPKHAFDRTFAFGNLNTLKDGIRDRLVTGVLTCALPIFDLMHAGESIRSVVVY